MSIIKNLSIILALNSCLIINSNNVQEDSALPTENIFVQLDNSEISQEDQVDIMFKNEEEIETPKFENPSKLVIFIRHYGIAFLNKYYDLKSWIIKKLNFKESIES